MRIRISGKFCMREEIKYKTMETSKSENIFTLNKVQLKISITYCLGTIHFTFTFKSLMWIAPYGC